MAQRTEHFPITVPAGTTQAAPQLTTLAFPDGHVRELEFIIPPGPSGLVGWRMQYGGQIVIPRSGVAFFVMDNVHERWALEDYPTGRQWQVSAYNTDVYPHLLQFTFHVDELQPGTVTPPPLIPLG
jgi:hypothetical protein